MTVLYLAKLPPITKRCAVVAKGLDATSRCILRKRQVFQAPNNARNFPFSMPVESLQGVSDDVSTLQAPEAMTPAHWLNLRQIVSQLSPSDRKGNKPLPHAMLDLSRRSS